MRLELTLVIGFNNRMAILCQTWSDEDETVSDSKGGSKNVLQEELDEESEPEDMDDMETCKYFA